MGWTTEEPTIPGIYLAVTREKGDTVGVSVTRFDYPQDDSPPGVYAASYTGQSGIVSYGWPRGKPMAEDFKVWQLVHPFSNDGPDTKRAASLNSNFEDPDGKDSD